MNAPLAKNLMDTIWAPHFPIYLDYSSTTPIDPRVADKMIPYLREQFGNPASRSHMYGWEAEKLFFAQRKGGHPVFQGLVVFEYLQGLSARLVERDS
jgi:selenocysteine lyase/cysteine desulfurase